jgi:hypothetical protein
MIGFGTLPTAVQMMSLCIVAVGKGEMANVISCKRDNSSGPVTVMPSYASENKKDAFLVPSKPSAM